MTGRKPLEWIDVGEQYWPMPACASCQVYLNKPGMAEAIASVGIETGEVDVKALVERYHEGRHKDG